MKPVQSKRNARTIHAGGVMIGGGFCLMAGPCAVESEHQLLGIAEAVKRSGAQFLRAGAFKPRTSPYDFQGLGEEGLKILTAAKAATGLPTISELTDAHFLPLFDDVDVIQVGARNMQNYELLKELGHQRKPVLLKRGYAATLRELLLSAEYVMSGGNENVILCERGIRTFDTDTRYTLDLTAVAALRDMTDLPVIVDPSHATGNAAFVPSMALAAAAAGADGVMLEVHTDPEHALCDGGQAITPDVFDALSIRLRALRELLFGEPV